MVDEELTPEELKMMEEGPEESQPETPVEPQEPAKPPTDFVPQQALHAERIKRQALEEKFNSYKNEMDYKIEEFRNFIETRRKSEEIEELDKDPFETLYSKSQQTEQEIANIKAELQQKELQSQEAVKIQQEHQAFVEKYQEQAREYIQKNPSFANAYRGLFASRAQEYMTMGYPQGEAEKYAAEDEMAIAYKAMEDGKNPAEVIFNLAKQRGFNSDSNDLQTVRRGIAETETLNNAPASHEPATDLERIMELDGEEFEKAWNKHFYG